MFKQLAKNLENRIFFLTFANKRFEFNFLQNIACIKIQILLITITIRKIIQIRRLMISTGCLIYLPSSQITCELQLLLMLSDWEPSAASETMSREMIHLSNGKKQKQCVAIQIALTEAWVHQKIPYSSSCSILQNGLTMVFLP